MVQVIYILAFIGNLRICWEYMESDSNWADGASRQLTSDPWAKKNEFPFKEISCAAVYSTHLLERVLQFVAFFGSGLHADVHKALRQLNAA